MTRIVALSDTHGSHEDIIVPDGDILIHAGDFCNYGTEKEIVGFGRWLRSLPHKYKIVIAGNHDRLFETNPGLAWDALAGNDSLMGLIYLRDSGTYVEGLHIYGSPWQPAYCDWAFNLPRNGKELVQKWSLIPEDLDILITHGPPYGWLDGKMRFLGCEKLALAVAVRKPKVHIFGHIHHGYGSALNGYGASLNVSVCNDNYDAVNPAWVINLTNLGHDKWIIR